MMNNNTETKDQIIKRLSKDNKPAMVTLENRSYMVKINGSELLLYNYMSDKTEGKLCNIDEITSIRGCSGFDF